MASKSHPIVILIERNGFSLYQDTSPAVNRFNFTADIVDHLDVVDRAKLITLINTFIQIHKIIPSSLLIILSDNVIYAKDLLTPKLSPGPTPANVVPDVAHKDEIKNFLDNVPFEDVLAKVIKINQFERIVAANKDLITEIAKVFESKGTVVEGVVPAFLYGQKVSFASGLTQSNISYALNSAEVLRIGNLLTNQQAMPSPVLNEQKAKEAPKKKQNTRQYILIGVFILLLVFLGVVFFVSSNGGGENKRARPQNFKDNTVSPTVAPNKISPTVTKVNFDLKTIKVKIVGSKASAEIADSISSKLKSLGFEDVASNLSEDSPAKSQVLFSSDIPFDVRNDMLSEIKKNLPGISVLENQDSNLTITILIGKS